MPRSRTGCLGSLIRLVAFLALVGVVVLAATALFQPWAFYLGGSFHVIPYWQGVGRVKTNTGGEYVIFVSMEPGGPTRLGGAYLKGNAFVCTPRHERIRLKMNAGMGRNVGRNTDGHAISVHMYYRSAFSMDPSTRPSLDFRGHWRGNSLVMTDVGSISRAFLADGSVNRGRLPAAGDSLPITITGGPKSEFDAACAAR